LWLLEGGKVSFICAMKKIGYFDFFSIYPLKTQNNPFSIFIFFAISSKN